MTKANEPLREWDFASEDNRGFHEAADIFPEMSAEEYQGLKADIQVNGLQTPIVTIPDGRIIDGRHRWRACMETKTEARYQVHHGNPWQYVISANLHRRHLNVSQRAMVADRLRTATSGGQPGNTNQVGHELKKSSARDIPKPVTRTDAATMLNVSTDAVHKAGVVNKKGTSDLKSLVDDGLSTVSTAARVAAMGEDIQQEFVRRVRSGEKPTDVARVPIEIPIYNGNKRKHAPVTVFTKSNAEGLSSGLVGMEMAFKDVVSIDQAVAADTARKLNAQIRSTKTVLNRLQKLLIEAAEER